MTRRLYHLGLRVVAAFSVMIALATSANAQWNVISLQPAGTYSHAYGVQGGQQVGSVSILGTGTWGAALWSGTAGSWVNIHPAGAPLATGGSQANAVGDGQQVGAVFYLNGGANTLFASLWSGTAASYVNLNPVGGIASEAYGVAGGQQVGVVHDEVISHASLWTGSATSWVSLHPAGGADWSEAHGVGGGQQVGFARRVGGFDHASLWSGTAASWVDLHPAAATNSIAYAIGGGQQAGIARVGSADHASLWSGTAASWVDLHPFGASRSEARGVFGGQQVGVAIVNSVSKAALWNGTAASWVDLNAFLPTGSWSEANGIWSDGTYTYVVGSSSQGAVMWRRALTDPPAAPGTPSLAKLTGGQVRITWADNSTNEGGFRVQREKKSGSSWIGTVIVATVGANVTSAINSPGTGTFRYRVQAFIGASDSAWSAWTQIKN